jgi:hypothetical protein
MYCGPISIYDPNYLGTMAAVFSGQSKHGVEFDCLPMHEEIPITIQTAQGNVHPSSVKISANNMPIWPYLEEPFAELRLSLDLIRTHLRTNFSNHHVIVIRRCVPCSQ